MTDKAQVYLNALQTGYRIEEYHYVTVGELTVVPFIPYSANRILLFVSMDSIENCRLYAVMQSGLLVHCSDMFETGTFKATMARDYSVSTFEYRLRNSGSVGLTINGFGIIKQ